MKHTELIERLVRLSDGSNVWISIALESVIKRPHDTFRIKPKTCSVTVDGVLYEWPEPMRVAPDSGTQCWFVAFLRLADFRWADSELDKEVLRAGLMQATKEGAEAHRRALIAVSGGEL
jgi:hypothetical protein